MGDGVTYVDRPICRDHHLPGLAPTTTQIAEAGTAWTCDDCGRTWTTVIQYATGAQCNTIWQSVAAPGKQSPLAQRVSAVEAATSSSGSAQSTLGAQVNALTTRAGTLEAAAAATAGHLSTLDTQTAAALARITALEARTVAVHAARVAVPALAVAAKVDLTVTWQTAFPDASYSVEANLSPALLGKATAALKTKTAAGATYTVTAGVLVAVGSDLLVTASRYA